MIHSTFTESRWVEKSFCRKKIHIINVSVETGDTSQNNSLEIPFVHSKTTFTATVKEIQ